MIYYKIIDSDGNIYELDSVPEIDDFLDIQNDLTKGFTCEKIEVKEYKELQSLENPTINYMYTKSDEDDEFLFKPTHSQKIKLLILEFFKTVRVAPEPEKLEKYYEWFVKAEEN